MYRVILGDDTIRVVDGKGRLVHEEDITEFFYDIIHDELEAIYDSTVDDVENAYRVLLQRAVKKEEIEKRINSVKEDKVEDTVSEYLYDVSDRVRRKIIATIRTALTTLEKQQLPQKRTVKKKEVEIA